MGPTLAPATLPWHTGDMNTATATRVHFVSQTGLVDTSTAGTVTDWTPVDPDGFTHPDMVEVTWEDGEVEILSVDNITEVWGSR